MARLVDDFLLLLYAPSRDMRMHTSIPRSPLVIPLRSGLSTQRICTASNVDSAQSL